MWTKYFKNFRWLALIADNKRQRWRQMFKVSEDTLWHMMVTLSLVYLIIIVSCHFTGHLAIYMGKLAAVKISSIYSIYYLVILLANYTQHFREESRNIILEEIFFHLNVDFNSLYGVYLVLMKGSCTMFTVVYFYIESNYKMINTWDALELLTTSWLAVRGEVEVETYKFWKTF